MMMVMVMVKISIYIVIIHTLTFTIESITFITWFTLALISARLIQTNGILTAIIMLTIRTFVNVYNEQTDKQTNEQNFHLSFNCHTSEEKKLAIKKRPFDLCQLKFSKHD